MILVDTSVWVDHFRRRNERLAAHLLDGEVLGHPAVLGEVALGHLRRREEVLGFLSELPQARPATDEEALAFIHRHALQGSGVGWVDAHLLASTAFSRTTLWTLDRRLAAVASRLSLAGRGGPSVLLQLAGLRSGQTSCFGRSRASFSRHPPRAL